MGEAPAPVLLVTANVGSIFEDPSVMLQIWTKEFLSTVERLQPLLIALHCQEVGGKNYEHSMKHVEDFVRLLMASNELRSFDKVRVFLDEDFTSAEKFTALGNFYFIHKSLIDVQIWDYDAKEFIDVIGKEVHSGNIENVTTKEKAKFPQEYFPECKWSRKGFIRTRWCIKGTHLDLINIHLFHDASNVIAMETYPSVYSCNRTRALQYALDRFHNDEYDNVPFFLFGDFNFRVDTQGVVKRLTSGLYPEECNNSSDKIQFKDNSSQVVLTIGTKDFSHIDHQQMFFNQTDWLHEYDKELEPFLNRLFEYEITFPPSYPFEEDLNSSQNYMPTRCPAWCDRIVMNEAAKYLVSGKESVNDVMYSIMGSNICMGDHKPVYLRFDLLAEAGSIICCTPPSLCCCVNHSSPIHEFLASPDSIIQDPMHVDVAPTSKRDSIINNKHRGAFNFAKFHRPVKRYNSASTMEMPASVKHHQCRCNSDFSSASLYRHGSFASSARIRLSQQSLRIQSHHSSSSEEWFEEIPEDDMDLDSRCRSSTIAVESHIFRRSKLSKDTVMDPDFTPPVKISKTRRQQCCVIL